MHQRALLERVGYLKAISIVTDITTPKRKENQTKTKTTTTTKRQKKTPPQNLNQPGFHVGKLS